MAVNFKDYTWLYLDMSINKCRYNLFSSSFFVIAVCKCVCVCEGGIKRTHICDHMSEHTWALSKHVWAHGAGCTSVFLFIYLWGRGRGAGSAISSIWIASCWPDELKAVSQLEQQPQLQIIQRGIIYSLSILFISKPLWPNFLTRRTTSPGKA